MSELQSKIREYLLESLIDEQDAAELTDTTPLMSSGILDSIALLDLTSFLREEFGVQLKAHEVGVQHLDTVESIAALVQQKLD